MAIDPLTGLPSSNNPVASTSTGYVPSTISTATMTPVTQVPVPAATPVPTSTYTAPINSVADSLTSLQQEAKDRQTAVDQANARGSEYAGLIATAQGQNIKDVAGTYASQGVNTAYNQLQDLAAQATGLKNEAAAIPIQNAIAYRGNAGVSSGVDTVSRDQLAQNALKALSLGQQYAIAEGNYNKAKNIADQLIDTKYAAEEARIKSLQTQQAAYEKYTLTPMEQKRLDAVKKATDLEASQLAEKKANEKGISDLITNAAGQGAPQELRDKATKAKTPMEAANILGQYAGDYLKNELLKEQIQQTRANTNKIRSETAKVDTQNSLLTAQPTGIVTAPNGDSIGIPNQTLASIGKLKLNEGQANAVAFVSRMIQASKAIDQQLGTISPTGGFYETTGYDPTSAGSAVGRFVGSDQNRTYNTNAQDFIRAKLRKESGAAIGQDEFDADAKIYTPSGVGLDEKDLLLAQTKRDEAIKSMIAQAGPAAPYLQQYFEQSKTKNYDYDPYLDDVVLPSINKSSQSSNSSSAYANSLLGK